MEMPDVRGKIVTRLRDGELPRAPAARLYGGFGSDTTCACCDQTISRNQLEFEVVFAELTMTVVMHPQCLRLWYDECCA
jgi:hypothetical protein